MFSSPCRKLLSPTLRVFRYRLYSYQQQNASQEHTSQPVELDESYNVLFNDVDMSALKRKARTQPEDLKAYHGRERNVVDETLVEDVEGSVSETLEEEEEIDMPQSKERKSPAATFGSRGIGAVVLPLELQEAIRSVVNGAVYFSLLVSTL
jgi:hypothetical protein